MNFFSKIAPLMIVFVLGTSTGSRAQTVTDYDGNVYQTLTIGEQVWMKENLKSLHYANGSPINEVLAYNNDNNLADTYGRLYTWDAAMKNSTLEKAQGVCPNGWHLPSHNEWMALAQQLGGTNVAGGKLKETGTTHWNSPNTGATNSSGFTVLPSGEYDNTQFQLLNEYAVLWSSTQTSTQWAMYFYLAYNDKELHPAEYEKGFYYSVRCVKNINSGIRKNNFHGLLIYPNPFDEYLIFDQKKRVSDSKVNSRIYNQYGQLVTEFNLADKLSKKDMQFLPPGTYFIKVQFENGQEYQKVIKR